MPFAEHILLENVCQWLHIEKLKTTFHFLKKKRKENQWLRPFASAIRTTSFSIEKYWSIKLKQCWRVREKLTVYYWFSENVKDNWNQCISIIICLTSHENVASQGKILEFRPLDTLKIEKLK